MSYSGQNAVSTRSAPFSKTPVCAERQGLMALDTLGSVCRFGRGETIFGEGDQLQCSYRIVSGAVRLSRVTEDGRRQIVEFRSAGDFVGFEWESHYALSAEAVRDVVAVRYMRTRVDRMIEERPDMREGIVALIRNELKAAHEHLITLGCQSARERVANFLLQLARKAGARDGDTLELELGRQDMADYLGLTLETVSRSLSEFKRIGAIDLPKRRKIRIVSRSKLRARLISIH